MEALRRREEALVEFARRERDLQLRRLREEVATCTAHLQHTTALVQFCIEALKESDSSAFLQVRFFLMIFFPLIDWRRRNHFFPPIPLDRVDASQPRLQPGLDVEAGNGRIDQPGQPDTRTHFR